MAYYKTIHEHLGRNVISVHLQCQSTDAKRLCIHDFKQKYMSDNHYDLGGTYTGSESDLWFYITTTTFAEKGHLINLFVCHRKVGVVVITVTLNGVTNSHIFKSNKPNENYHLKTFSVTEELIASTNENVLFIPVTVEIEPAQLVDPEVIKKIKNDNSLGEKLRIKNTDFVLESISGTQYAVHKLVLCAHSPVLRELVKSSAKTSAFLDISDEYMNLLIQFLYTGTVTDVHKTECMRLQELACKFELSNLFLLAQHYICDQINVENAVDIAVLAKKYNLDKLWEKVCTFIQENPAVLSTEKWKAVDDIDLAKNICATLVKLN
ncbi:uncharacterized protein LOC128670353 [Plodia interpunctella]|uniref:uncharacterized protein LOC128670353 n=1 Tax=Plodia interpunctella TaxID=58824 RepID=UPI002367C75D|nr:uncharacterized protein LOC128670353 [Plodia interpunctella]XP_053601926.1 uncharacterized protein LOC128670353 [Plodia interpunctella]XP_053601928.1 uncharacterized protein LOC128670353 [Plodia interpunctella]